MNENNLTITRRIFYAILSAIIGTSAELITGFVDLNFWGVDIFDVGTFHNYIFDLWFIHIAFAIVAGAVGYTHGPKFWKIVKFDPDIF